MNDSVTRSELENARGKARTVTAYHRVFSTPEGRIVLDHMKAQFGFDLPAFLPDERGHFNAIHAAVRDGQRQVILHVETILKTTKPDGDGNVEKPAVTIITENPTK